MKKKIDKSQIKFFLGYSGWNSNQLNEEIEEKAWIIDNANEIENLALNTKKNIWKNKLISMGGEYLIWSNSPENPQHN